MFLGGTNCFKFLVIPTDNSTPQHLTFEKIYKPAESVSRFLKSKIIRKLLNCGNFPKISKIFLEDFLFYIILGKSLFF